MRMCVSARQLEQEPGNASQRRLRPLGYIQLRSYGRRTDLLHAFRIEESHRSV